MPGTLTPSTGTPKRGQLHRFRLDQHLDHFQFLWPADGEDGWTVSPGDKIMVQVWNANTLAGPSMFLLTAVGGTDAGAAGHRLLPSPLGEGQCVLMV